VERIDIIKIHISEVRDGRYFRDGPPAQKLFFHEDNNMKPVVPVHAEVLSSSVSKCLEQFFPNGRILPFNIPSFLNKIITVKYISGKGDAVVDIDVDIGKLGDAIHNRGMRLLDEKQYKDSSSTFRAQGILQPQNPIPFYNVACVESLQGNLDEAILNLNTSIDKGYRNLAHMLNDEDLAGIRHTDQWNAVCSRLKTLIYEENPPEKEEINQPKELQPEPTKVPEKVEVPQIPPPKPELPEQLKLPQIPQPEPEPTKEPETVEGPKPALPEQLKLPEIPQPPPQPVKVPEPEVRLPDSVLLTPYFQELEVLHDIGYLNDTIVVPILEKHKGNVQQTVLELLDM